MMKFLKSALADYAPCATYRENSPSSEHVDVFQRDSVASADDYTISSMENKADIEANDDSQRETGSADVEECLNDSLPSDLAMRNDRVIDRGERRLTQLIEERMRGGEGKCRRYKRQPVSAASESIVAARRFSRSGKGDR